MPPLSRYTSVIPCNVFGPHDNYNLEDAHVIPALIHKTYLAQQANQPLKVLGTGKVPRDPRSCPFAEHVKFSHSGNLSTPSTWLSYSSGRCENTRLPIQHNASRSKSNTEASFKEIDPIIFSVGEEDEVTIRDAVDAIVKAFDFKVVFRYPHIIWAICLNSHLFLKGEVHFDSTKADGQLKKTASNHKLRKYLPDFKFTPFPEAIQHSVKWFIENHDAARK